MNLVRRVAFVAGAGALLAGCGNQSDSLTIQLDELNGSGVSGEVRLERTGEFTTRMSVAEVRGGPITAAWIATGQCGDSGDEIITVHPPTGTAPVTSLRSPPRRPHSSRCFSAVAASSHAAS